MSAPNTIVIAGGGLAGATAAFALREQGYAGRVVLVSEEATPPYERPPLSKGYLRGEEPLERAFVRPPADYAASDIELLAGRRVMSLDVVARRVELDDGSRLAFDALLIATGSEPRRLDVPGAVRGVHYLRTVADADAIRAAAAEADSVALVGGGWVGSEVAASLRQLGRTVTIVSDPPRPLERVLGPEVAEVYRALHAEHGVRFVTGRVASVESARGQALLRLRDGRTVSADLVVAGVGATPRLELASGAGLAIAEGGIAVDEHLRTAAPDVWAAGDVAAAWHPRLRRRIRVEHWDNAIEQGMAAAASMLGTGAPYARTPYFFSDQFDLGMEYRGFAPRWDRVVLRGDVERREFLAFWIADGRVAAALNANVWDAGDELARLVDSDDAVDPDRLADAAVPLAEAA